MDNQTVWNLVFVVLSFGLYIGIAIWARVQSTKGFYVAGQGVPTVLNGMATGADWMSAASFMGMAGLISVMGYTGSMYLIGWTGGYVLLAMLLAPYLRKFGKFTVPDFVGDRYYSNTARAVAIFCAIFVSFTYVCGQMRGVGIVFANLLGWEIFWGVVVGIGMVFFYATLGGMKGITYTQVAQYCVLISAFVIPAVAISSQMTGNPIPQIGFGSTINGGENAGLFLLDALDKIHSDLGLPEYINLWRREEEHDRRVHDHGRADGRDGGSAARDHSLLHREDCGRGAMERLFGPWSSSAFSTLRLQLLERLPG